MTDKYEKIVSIRQKYRTTKIPNDKNTERQNVLKYKNKNNINSDFQPWRIVHG